jgi:hypothetical protein
MDKTVRLGTAKTPGDMWYSVYCRIRIKPGGVLSITGVEGPTIAGNCYGSCGQISSALDPDKIQPAPEWTRERIRHFLAIWQRWHLNDMRAGTPRQEAYLREHILDYIKEKSECNVSLPHHNWATRVLDGAGLNPDPELLHSVNGKIGPYRYGSAWLTEVLPLDVLAWLDALPLADKTPAWV